MRPSALLSRLRSRPLATPSALVLLALSVIALFAEPLASFGSAALGGDAGARFSALVLGSQTALGLGVAVALLSLLLGGLLGGLAGAVGGIFDSLVVRWVEAMGVFPAVILAALLRAMEPEPSLLSLVAVATFVRSAEMARLVRLLVVEGYATGWALSARALGASPFRIFLRHILPGGRGTVLVSAYFSISSVVLLETSLSFLGLGVPKEVASWGQMLGEFRPESSLGALLPPVLALVVTLGALSRVGDALRATGSEPA